jgi:phytoene/squalene synthetase
MNDRFRELMRFEVKRTRDLFKAGEPLLRTTVPTLRFELRLTLHGGMRILEKIERSGFDVFNARPVLRTADKVAILLKAILPAPHRGR